MSVALPDRRCEFCTARLVPPPTMGPKAWARRRFCSRACSGRSMVGRPTNATQAAVLKSVHVPAPGTGPAIRPGDRSSVTSCRKCHGALLIRHDLGMQCWDCRTIMYTQDGDWEAEASKVPSIHMLERADGGGHRGSRR